MGRWVLAGMILVSGALFTALGLGILKSTRRKRATWIQTTADVVGLAEVRNQIYSADPSGPLYTEFKSYAPVYRYYADGELRTAKAKISSSPERYRVGDTILVLVDPMNPQESEIFERRPFVFSYVVIVTGLVLLAIGCLIVRLVITGGMG